MADTGRMDPFENMISLVAGPIAAVIRSFDQLRRGTEELLRGMENFNATMETLNETASRVNRLLNDFEEPIRAMLPQLTRTVKLADELSTRLAGPVDQVAPGLTRLAETLNSPIFNTLPRDLGQFMEIINDLGRRMSPLAQLAEQAGGMFGLRIPGLSTRSGGARSRSDSSSGGGHLGTGPGRRRPGRTGIGADDDAGGRLSRADVGSRPTGDGEEDGHEAGAGEAGDDEAGDDEEDGRQEDRDEEEAGEEGVVVTPGC